MLHPVTSSSHSYYSLLCDDPVRPEVPYSVRVCSPRSVVFVSEEGGQVQAVVCVLFTDRVPSSVDQLLEQLRSSDDQYSVAVFYTIWSYSSGSGARLIFSVRSWIKSNRSEVSRFVTLSPATELARKFHLRNGAREWRHNDSTVNYEYL